LNNAHALERLLRVCRIPCGASIENGGLKGIKKDRRDARATTKTFLGMRHEMLDVAHPQNPLLVYPIHPP